MQRTYHKLQRAFAEEWNLRSLLVEKYLSYRIAITKLKNSDEWVKLSSDVRKEIVQQEKVFIELTDAKNIPNDQWVLRVLLLMEKQARIY
ncbi:hypothetical protein [Capnocytophaga ochracea]|uniref:hypothetical protein n=1 Tax=Capnocytophaga ochracea TaxID=1018 RepID=UPI00209276D2|nr:hypothetical protein [Capnocytophaga ochracea]